MYAAKYGKKKNMDKKDGVLKIDVSL